MGQTANARTIGIPSNECMRRQPPLGELGGAKSLPLNSSLGLGSALGEKGKKSAWAKKKIGKQSESRGSPGHRWAHFARQYFSYLTPFLAFFPTAECGPRLSEFSYFKTDQEAGKFKERAAMHHASSAQTRHDGI